MLLVRKTAQPSIGHINHINHIGQRIEFAETRDMQSMSVGITPPWR